MKDYYVGKCVVVNFDIVCKMSWLDEVDDNWTIIVDESHKIKNMGTKKSPVKITQKVLELGEKLHIKLFLQLLQLKKNLVVILIYILN